jgi:hypothetical protein
LVRKEDKPYRNGDLYGEGEEKLYGKWEVHQEGARH